MTAIMRLFNNLFVYYEYVKIMELKLINLYILKLIIILKISTCISCKRTCRKSISFILMTSLQSETRACTFNINVWGQ